MSGSGASIPNDGAGSGMNPYGGDGTSIPSDNPIVNLAEIVKAGANKQVICYLDAGDTGSQNRIGVRISAIFVVLFVSSAVTFFPVLATRVKKLKIPIYVYLFARYFGAGVIIATAFVQ